MSNIITHLEPYGYDTEEDFKPSVCGDITITINSNCDCDNDKDKEQDDAIGKKANTSDVNEALGKVSDAINANTHNVAELSGLINANADAIETNAKVDEEQNRKLLELSGKVETSVNLTAITAIESAITESLKADFYTKCETDEKFATIDDLGAYTEVIVGEFSGYAETTDERIEALENQNTNTNTITAHLSEMISANSSSISVLSENKLDKDAFNTYSAETEGALNALDSKVYANGNAIMLKADKSYVDLQDEKLGGLIEENTSNIAKKADSTYVDGKVSALSNAISKNATDIENMSLTLANKAEKDVVDRLSSKVSSFDTYVQEISMDKADLSDLIALSGEVGSLSDELATKASSESVETISATVNNNVASIDRLDANKQDKGDFVSASTLNDYYKKSETLSADEIQSALNGKQVAGDYVLNSAMSNYYTKDEVLDIDTFNEFSSNTKTSIDEKATKGSVEQLNGKVYNIQSGMTTALNDISTLTNVLNSDYATIDYVDKSVSGITKGITDNNELIAKISSINNLKLYDPSTGQFIDDGNGVLDVLHRKFHLLVKGIDETDSDLEGYLAKLEQRIKALEDKP